MVSHHPAKLYGHRQCGSGKILILVVEEEDARCFCLQGISTGNDLKEHDISYL